MSKQRQIGTAFREPLPERFWKKVAFMPGGCWEWQGCRTPFGHGQIGLGRREWGVASAHRVSWELHHQESIPEGKRVLHSCDNPPCVNPWHLRLGTDADNVRDMWERGRQATGFRLPHTRLSDEDVREIRALYDPRGGYLPPGVGGVRSNAGELADRFGVARSYITQLANRHERRAVGA